MERLLFRTELAHANVGGGMNGTHIPGVLAQQQNVED